MAIGFIVDLRQLRYFLTIHEEGSLTRAAERLNVAQPALSLHVRRLEEELGVDLLVRTSRGVRTTESGDHLAAHARAILAQVDSAREAIRQQAVHPRGRVVLGIPTSLGPVLTVPLVEAAQRTFPDVSLRVAEGLSGHILEWLLAGRVDIALLLSPGAVPGLTSERMVTERLFLIGPPGDPAMGRLTAARPDASVPFAAMAEFPLILPGQPHRLRDEVESAARAAAVDLRVVIEIDALDHMKALVLRGAGYTVLSLRVAYEEVLDGRLSAAPLCEPKIERSIHLAHVSERPLGSAARHVRDLMKLMLAERIVGGRWRSEVEWMHANEGSGR